MFLPGAAVQLEDPVLTTLFSETYGRYLVAFRDKEQLRELPCRIIGEVTSGGLRIHSKGEAVYLSPEQVEFALSSLSRTMRG
ncbi:hypothetical protein ASZ90_015599 [hydrocarbon metagenome]|uniref:Uncharacterized protein n=1 Tax=hydrocarbon metagenome TaxID=938273 RepID=A0A0W8F1E6_9ZZZZ